MRQWILLGLLSGLVACQFQPITPPQSLLKSVDYIVYVNGKRSRPLLGIRHSRAFVVNSPHPNSESFPPC